MAKETIIRLKGKKKAIGKVVDNTFITRRDPEKHVLHSHNAVGISTKVINHLVTMGVKNVEMRIGDKIFRAPLNRWQMSGFVRNFEDEQKFVTIHALEEGHHQSSLENFK